MVATRTIADCRCRSGRPPCGNRFAEHAYEMAHSVGPDEFYSRHGNPTVSAFADAVADIKVPKGRLHSPLAWALLQCCLRLVFDRQSCATTQIYGTTATFLNGPVARMGIQTTWVNACEPGAMAAAVIPVARCSSSQKPRQNLRSTSLTSMNSAPSRRPSPCGLNPCDTLRPTTDLWG